MTLPPGCPRPRVLRLLLSLAAAPLLVLLLAGPASAHATLLFATPSADGSVPDTPDRLTLVFNEPVSTAGTPVRLTGPDGQRITVGTAELSRGRTVVDVTVTGSMPTGAYTVDWQVASNDGDTVAGRYRFAVGPALSTTLTATASGSTATPGAPATVAARWLMYSSLSVALGGLGVQVLLRRRMGAPVAEEPRSWLLPAAVAGAFAAFATALLVLGDGSLLRGLSGFSVSRLTDTRPGTMALIEVDAFVLTALLAVTRRRMWAFIPLAAVAVAEGIRGHVGSAQPGWGAVLATVHTLAAALWVGGLVQAVRTAWAWRAEPGRARRAMGEYARAALWPAAVILGTGTAAALVLLSPGELLDTGYGQLLLAKVALVALALGCAVAARACLRRAEPAVRVTVPARAEAGVLAAVLAMSAVLTGFSPPRDGTTDLPYAPPASGTVVPVGARAGLIGVHAQADSGQLVVRLTTPDSASAEAPQPAGTHLKGSIAAPGGRTRSLAFRRCGDGCYAAPVTWRTGTSHLTLRADADDWTGGTAALDVPWPARSGTALLRKTVGAMREASSFSLYERTTSDTTTGAGNPMHLTLSGQRFLQSEPYTEGRAAQAALGGRTTDGTVLLLGFPAENIEARLVVAPDGRVLRETLTVPNHLVTRTFLYSEAGE